MSAGLISEMIYQVYKSTTKQKKESRLDLFHRVLFFPDKVVACKAHFRGRDGCKNVNCHFSHSDTSLSELLKYITNAKRSLDVCVFSICCHELADVLVESHERGVIVRVVTDGEQTGATGSQIGKFRSKGIQVRHDNSSFLMHHKYVIIDGEILINGSFNWTRSAVTGNHENVVITNNTELLKPFEEEFENLWELYEPSKHLK
ncbi:uncharacterized protein LOC100369067 [Saccoglossus kowalevskii]|uniref:Mitochondrial cardiolipin hydrolase n=1 Tax=Saccoglossus kowalevskii TaxID=10224 RepID=A0ABM0GKV0_SACKO|nr:PREDICTED: mitochondrial cardiolipin hydrolase-like [Saccoglossus kowalevskii]